MLLRRHERDRRGSNTAMVQIAAEVLGVEADAVALVSGDTETTPFDMLTAASRVTVSVGNAAARRCRCP